MKKLPELLMPAGSLEKAQYAFKYGADAVYLGLPDFSLRSRVNEFTEKRILKAVSDAHRIQKKVYVTINVFPHNKKLEKLVKHLKFLKKTSPDAVILSDMGVLNLVQKICSNIPIHLSVQANTVNSKAVEFWKNLGIKRIVLAREVTLEEIKKIRNDVPDIELEVFVHGAMCVAMAGRCLLSKWFTGRDANQGDCAQSCRWKYSVRQIQNNVTKFALEEDIRKGEYFPIEEYRDGSHIMSSRDICLIEYIDKLWKSGVNSFKVEGRSKTVYYAAVVAKAYRKVIDEKQSLGWAKKEICKVSNRGYCLGFLFGEPTEKGYQYDGRNSDKSDWKFLGKVLCSARCSRRAKCMVIKVDIKNRINLRDNIEIIYPEGEFKMKIEEMYNKDFEPIETAHGGAGSVWIKVNRNVVKWSLLRKKIIV